MYLMCGLPTLYISNVFHYCYLNIDSNRIAIQTGNNWEYGYNDGCCIPNSLMGRGFYSEVVTINYYTHQQFATCATMSDLGVLVCKHVCECMCACVRACVYIKQCNHTYYNLYHSGTCDKYVVKMS